MECENKKLSLSKRRELYQKEVRDKMMNPVENFNPRTFDPMDDGSDKYKVAKRKRKAPPKELPTYGMYPKEIMEGQMIGNYESKQDLYLIMANKINELQKRIEELENKQILCLNKTKNKRTKTGR